MAPLSPWFQYSYTMLPVDNMVGETNVVYVDDDRTSSYRAADGVEDGQIETRSRRCWHRSRCIASFFSCCWHSADLPC